MVQVYDDASSLVVDDQQAVFACLVGADVHVQVGVEGDDALMLLYSV